MYIKCVKTWSVVGAYKEAEAKMFLDEACQADVRPFPF